MRANISPWRSPIQPLRREPASLKFYAPCRENSGMMLAYEMSMFKREIGEGGHTARSSHGPKRKSNEHC